MKSTISYIIIFVAVVNLLWATLIMNRIQRKCVDIGKPSSGELTKISFVTSEMRVDEPVKSAMINCHAGVGGIMILFFVNYVLLAAVAILVVINYKKNPNQDIQPKTNSLD